MLAINRYRDRSVMGHLLDGCAYPAAVLYQHGGGPQLSGTAKALIGLAAAGGILIVLIVSAGIFLLILSIPSRHTTTDSAPAPNAARVRCQPVEQLANHFHTRLTILQDGSPLTIPAYIGIRPSCIYWLHTHDTSGVIHIETPITEFRTTFTLGDFFSVWGEPIDSSHAGPANVTSDRSMKTWVQADPSATAESWGKNPATIPLHDCEAITIEIGSGASAAPEYGFPSGFGCE
jgi:hypothetical protein